MTAGMPLKTMMRSQIPAVPMAQPHRSTGAIHADRAGGTAPTPEAVTGNARWPEPGQGTGSPDPCKEERGKKKNQPIGTGYTWDLTCPHLAWIPRKLSSLNSTEAPQHPPRRCLQQPRHRYKSPPTDERINHTWSLQRMDRLITQP